MTEIREHLWQPIQDLAPNWELLRDSELHSLMTAWQEQAVSLREGRAYHDFLVKLRREWAIETGQIERLYDISAGATKTLIEQGFDASLLTHEDVDQAPELVIDYIKDQHRAIEGLYQFSSGVQTLGTSYIKELHCVLTEHQKQYYARDTLGNFVWRDLPRGAWKMAPSYVKHEDGTVFAFCPYEHVSAEMDQLISWHLEHEKQKVSPEIESAWLHHRFTLIHPFVDGNGRVARCLASLVLLKNLWFPLVVTRDDRAPYLSAIRQADAGDLAPLVALVGGLQKRAITRAMSLNEEVHKGTAAINEILDRVKRKVQHDRTAQQQLRKQVLDFGDQLWESACQKLERVVDQVKHAIEDPEHPKHHAYVDRAQPASERAGYFRFQIGQTATELHHYANLSDFRAWTRLVMITETQVEVLFAFHGIGREFTGVLACAGMAYTKQTTEIADLQPLVKEPFYFAYNEIKSDSQSF